MGLKPGEKLERLGLIKILNVRRESLHMITRDDVIREGFPEFDKWEFIEMLVEHMGGDASQEVTRIQYEYL